MSFRFAPTAAICIALVSIALAGCQATAGGRNLPIDLRYAKTDQGYVNSGLGQLGNLIYVDLAEKTASPVEVVTLDPAAIATSGNSSLTTSNISGFEVSFAGLPLSLAEQVQVKADIGRKSAIKLVDFELAELRHPWEAVTARLNTLDEDAKVAWRLQDAVAGRDRIYVLVSRKVSANSADFYVGDRNDAGSGIEIAVGPTKLKLIAANNSRLTWSGKGTPVLIGLYAFAMRLDAGRYRFRTLTLAEERRVRENLIASLKGA